jgi:hypothetical protein
MLRQA